MSETPSGILFVRAFDALLEKDPHVAPSPTQLNLQLGREDKAKLNQLNGRETKLRRKLLINAGFTKDSRNRWYR